MTFEPLQSLPGRSVQPEGTRDVLRTLPEEVPVAVVVNGSTLAVMMCTPADIEDFAVGFLLSETVIDTPAQVERLDVVTHARGIEAQTWVSAAKAEALSARRRATAGPVGCGLCGIDSVEQAVRPLPIVRSQVTLSPAEIAQASDLLRHHQPLHDQSHALHGAGFLCPGAGIIAAREDVGRHNALDKLIGHLARKGVDPAAGALVLTSRLSLELVQKAAQANCAILIGVSAPTAHAVRLAREAGLTLAAFARGGGFDLYSHPTRVTDGASHVA